jgi:hypothetical protein
MVDLPIDNNVINKSKIGLPFARPGYFDDTLNIKKIFLLFYKIFVYLANMIDPPTGTRKFLSVLWTTIVH